MSFFNQKTNLWFVSGSIKIYSCFKKIFLPFKITLNLFMNTLLIISMIFRREINDTELIGKEGFEPSTLRFGNACSSPLSYKPFVKLNKK